LSTDLWELCKHCGHFYEGKCRAFCSPETLTEMEHRKGAKCLCAEKSLVTLSITWILQNMIEDKLADMCEKVVTDILKIDNIDKLTLTDLHHAINISMQGLRVRLSSEVVEELSRHLIGRDTRARVVWRREQWAKIRE